MNNTYPHLYVTLILKAKSTDASTLPGELLRQSYYDRASIECERLLSEGWKISELQEIIRMEIALYYEED